MAHESNLSTGHERRAGKGVAAGRDASEASGGGGAPDGAVCGWVLHATLGLALMGLGLAAALFDTTIAAIGLAVAGLVFLWMRSFTRVA